MTDRSHSIKNLTMDDLVKSEGDSYKIVRNDQYLGAFVKIGETYHYRDQQHNTWVCHCNSLDTGAADIRDAVAFMSY